MSGLLISIFGFFNSASNIFPSTFILISGLFISNFFPFKSIFGPLILGPSTFKSTLLLMFGKSLVSKLKSAPGINPDIKISGLSIFMFGPLISTFPIFLFISTFGAFILGASTFILGPLTSNLGIFPEILPLGILTSPLISLPFPSIL